ncbi:MAG: archease [Deltaproteobacteria bacterium]|nr:archease [Deltaproteobacteria bacterium]
MADHSFEEHVGEVRLLVRAGTLAELFAESGRALAELMTDAAGAPTGATEHVVVRARDREALLVEWINELVYRSETRKKVYTEFDVERVDDHELSVAAHGVDATDLRTAVKAATFHDLRIDEGPEGFRASVVLDV